MSLPDRIIEALIAILWIHARSGLHDEPICSIPIQEAPQADDRQAHCHCIVEHIIDHEMGVVMQIIVVRAREIEYTIAQCEVRTSSANKVWFVLIGQSGKRGERT